MKRMMAMPALLCVALAAMSAATPSGAEIAAKAAPRAAAAGRPLRDPFARPAPPPVAAGEAAEPPPPPPLHLRAVILNGVHSIANIDGDIVGAGEQTRDYTVVRIDARGVLVTRAGKQQLLTINPKDTQ
jgi:hypothetical protein